MLIVVLHRRYQRACRECGFTWVVSRREAQYHPRFSTLRESLSASPPSFVGQAYRGAEEVAESEEQVVEAFRRCPSCGVEDFAQRPVTRGHPADPLAKPLDSGR